MAPCRVPITPWYLIRPGGPKVPPARTTTGLCRFGANLPEASASGRFGRRDVVHRRLKMGIVRALRMGGYVEPLTCSVAAPQTTAEVTRAVKNTRAREANLILGRTGLRFWQDKSYDHRVRDGKELERIVRYIEWNPVRAGLVGRAELWPWSSASENVVWQVGDLPHDTQP
jgi:hypothetical protein